MFIRSWLYLASVQDPFGEFFVKALPSTALKKTLGKSFEQDALLSYQVRFHYLCYISNISCFDLVDYALIDGGLSSFQ